MPAVKLYVLPCLLALLGAGLLLALIRNLSLARKPLQFGQATVVATLPEGKAAFRLFDGQTITLEVEPKLLEKLHEGDYGRASYCSNRLLTWQQTPQNS